MKTKSPRWRVGDLAKLTGLTVRTLHHYEEIGLLEPASRTESGHRVYLRDRLRRICRHRSSKVEADELLATIEMMSRLQRHVDARQRLRAARTDPSLESQ